MGYLNTGSLLIWWKSGDYFYWKWVLLLLITYMKKACACRDRGFSFLLCSRNVYCGHEALKIGVMVFMFPSIGLFLLCLCVFRPLTWNGRDRQYVLTFDMELT